MYIEEGDGQRVIGLLERLLFGARIRFNVLDGSGEMEVQVCTFMCVYVRMCMDMYERFAPRAERCMNIYKYIYIYIYIYTHICVYMCVCVCMYTHAGRYYMDNSASKGIFV
jgi:hypothetical protein